MRLASAADFFNGPIYTRYPLPDEVYDRRAKPFYFYHDPILVVGCGFGGLVRALRDLGKQVWGIDASQWAIDNRDSRVENRVFNFDILDLSNWTMGEMGTVITEDLLPHLNNDEAMLAARNCQALAPIVIHMVTEQGQADLNYHSCAEWMRMTNQPTISLEGM